jgi:ubiquinone/menaquinone biosynthesis C-methylase UbiE
MQTRELSRCRSMEKPGVRWAFMKFDSETARGTYSDRKVDCSWASWIEENHPPSGLDIIDIGCGGGIYSKYFAQHGARSVHGIDSSGQYIVEANQSLEEGGNCRFTVGEATELEIEPDSFDLAFERALIHHLTIVQQQKNANEVYRILRPGGTAIIQDRTFEDVLSAKPAFWIRSTLFELFPSLVEFERSRRPNAEAYTCVLQEAGFSEVNREIFIETRKTHSDFALLRSEILQRKGKSILFELTDPELDDYCNKLVEKSQSKKLAECDQWSIWSATK